MAAGPAGQPAGPAQVGQLCDGLFEPRLGFGDPGQLPIGPAHIRQRYKISAGRELAGWGYLATTAATAATICATWSGAAPGDGGGSASSAARPARARGHPASAGS